MAEPIPAAIQLYTVRDALEKDFEGPLEKLAEMGYQGVEFSNLFGNSPDAVRGMIDRFGLQCAGFHSGFSAEDPTAKVAGMIDTLGALGGKWVTAPSLPGPFRESAEGYEKAAAALNEIGALFAAAGIRLGYHNHAFEFMPLGDTCGMQILIEKTDPKVVDLQFDTYWVARGGWPVAETIRKHADRVQLVHIKDGTLTGDDLDDTEVGNGELEWGPIFEASSAAGAKWAIVEQDHPKGGSLNASAKSIAFLKGAGYVS
jgi:sugar phosphate isomerase/epimerase